MLCVAIEGRKGGTPHQPPPQAIAKRREWPRQPFRELSGGNYVSLQEYLLAPKGADASPLPRAFVAEFSKYRYVNDQGVAQTQTVSRAEEVALTDRLTSTVPIEVR